MKVTQIIISSIFIILSNITCLRKLWLQYKLERFRDNRLPKYFISLPFYPSFRNYFIYLKNIFLLMCPFLLIFNDIEEERKIIFQINITLLIFYLNVIIFYILISIYF